MKRMNTLERKIRYGVGTLVIGGLLYFGISIDTGTYNPLKWKQNATQKENNEQKVDSSYNAFIDSNNIDTSLARILKENTPFEDKEKLVNRLHSKPSN